jgi:hypothetical protein
MARYAYTNTTVDQNGKIFGGATVTAYLAGTTTLASIYAASAGGVAVHSVTSSIVDGSFSFYVDTGDYGLSQEFKTVISKQNYTTRTIDSIVISPSATIITPANTVVGNIVTWTGVLGDEIGDSGIKVTTSVLYLSHYASVAAAVASIGANVATLVLDIAGVVSIDTHIPFTLSIVQTNMSLITINNGITLTINGPFAAGLYPVFSCIGTGVVQFGSGIEKIYPEWFGAVGDATTDETSIIRTTFLSMPSSGATIWLQKKYGISYDGIDAPILKVRSNMVVDGPGGFINIGITVASNYWQMIGNNNDGALNNVKLRNFELDGANPNTEYGSGWEQNHGVEFYNSSDALTNITIDNLYVHDMGGDGIVVTRGVDGASIMNCRIKDVRRQGISLAYSKNVRVIANAHLGNTGATTSSGNSIHSEGGVPENITLIDNLCPLGISVAGTNGAVVDGNYLTGANLTLNAGLNLKIVNNILESGYITGQDCTGDILVSGNTIKNATGIGIYFVDTGAPSVLTKLRVTGNYINATAEGIKMNATNTSIIDNNIITSGTFGIYVTYAAGAIYNNRISAGSYGIYLYDAVGQKHMRELIYCYNNAILAYVTYGIRLVYVRAVVFDNFTDSVSLGTGPQLWPRTIGTRQSVTSSTIPTYGVWAIGDRWESSLGTVGQPLGAICTAAGGLSLGAWSGASTYHIGDFVTGSNSKVYEAILEGGQAEDPITGGSTYWVLRANNVATFTNMANL